MFVLSLSVVVEPVVLETAMKVVAVVEPAASLAFPQSSLEVRPTQSESETAEFPTPIQARSVALALLLQLLDTRPVAVVAEVAAARNLAEMEHLVVVEADAVRIRKAAIQVIKALATLVVLDSTTELAAAAAVPVVQVPTVQIGRTQMTLPWSGVEPVPGLVRTFSGRQRNSQRVEMVPLDVMVRATRLRSWLLQ
jgi:hypothetical protein